MALMTGYRRDLETKLIRGNAAVVAYPVAGEASTLDAEGQYVTKNAIDASLSLLGRISGRAYDANGGGALKPQELAAP